MRRVMLVCLAGMVLLTSACSLWADDGSARSGGTPDAAPASSAPPPVVASVDSVLANRPLFGIYLRDRSDTEVDKVSRAAGCRPALVELFASVADGVSTQTIASVPGTPVLSIEPWHVGRGENQKDFTLRSTVDGAWDEQYQKMALAVKEYAQPVLIRYAHEMNGHWYPWSITNGNTSGDYIAAWKHVVDLFRAEGVTNALWVWSPNILRGAASRTIQQFWPGEKYVDLVGLTGYGVRESSPSKTYSTTLTLVRRLTDKPVILTEMGVQPDATKRQWIAGFGRWLRDNRQVAGFIWNQVPHDEENWRFDDTAANLAAFKKSLSDGKVHC